MKCFHSAPLGFSVAFLWVLLSLGHVEAQNRVDEVQALTSFRKQMELPVYLNWGNPAYWFTWNETDENACGWLGVTCSSNFTVAALDLSGWGIGNLSSMEAFSKLPDLRQLDLSENFLFRIPDDISLLTGLSWLDFSRSWLSGGIPSNISACRNLHYISLEENALDGELPDLSALVNLQFLLLDGNRFSGPIPTELGDMSRLVCLDLSGNQFNGSIPSFAKATYLVNLTLDSNNLTGFEELFYINAPELQYLQVSGNQLEGTLPLGLTKLLNVRQIDISRNLLSGSIPSGFSNLYFHYLSMYLSQNKLSGSIPLDLVQSPYDMFLFINASHNLLNGSIPVPSIRGNVNASIVLDLSYNRLEGHVPSQLSGIFALLVNNNLLSGDIVDVLQSQVFLSAGFLYLGSNFFTGDLTRITNDWATWDQLLEVDLTNNNLSWRPTEFIRDPVGAAINNFPIDCIWFNVSGNNFSGTSLPFTPVSSNSSLVVLDLSDTQIQGTISGDFFNSASLPVIQWLILSNNEATGSVPESIFALPDLTVLDLSNNSLSGSLPYIPLNSNFIINPLYYEGNDASLCGYPLQSCADPRKESTAGVHWLLLLLVTGGSLTVAAGSCLVATWRWRVYRQRHEQDADLIRTLMERDSVTLMPLRTLKKATGNFAESAQIGEGGFGTVYAGKLQDGTALAIKKSKRGGSEIDKDQFLNEVKILSQVNHCHLVKLMGCCMENGVALLVFEFISNGTLREYLQSKDGNAC